jgi:hypothetical protein
MFTCICTYMNLCRRLPLIHIHTHAHTCTHTNIHKHILTLSLKHSHSHTLYTTLSHTHTHTVLRGTHPAYTTLNTRYTMGDKKFVTRLQSTCSLLTHWSPIFAEVSTSKLKRILLDYIQTILIMMITMDKY